MIPADSVGHAFASALARRPEPIITFRSDIMARVVGSIPPHGGQLMNRTLRGELREAALERARSFPQVQLTPMAVSDLELIAVGALSPLTGFMTKADYDSVIDTMHMANGLAWSIPVTL